MAENEVPPTTSHTDAAQARIQEIRAMRQQIPNFTFPSSPSETKRMLSAASVPPQFVELTTVAVKNSTALVRGGGTEATEVRDLASFADAYEPVAAELDMLARFVRHSVTVARSKIGSDALTTYALAQRLAKRPETADLVPLVREMRRALGRGRRSKSESPVTTDPAPVPPTTEPVPVTTTDPKP
jgi:hypothetical protein